MADQGCFALQRDKTYMELVIQSRNEYEQILIHSFFKKFYFKNINNILDDPIDDLYFKESIFKVIGLTSDIINYIRINKGGDITAEEEAHYIYEELKSRQRKNPDDEASNILKKIKEEFHKLIIDFNDEYGLYLPRLEDIRIKGNYDNPPTHLFELIMNVSLFKKFTKKKEAPELSNSSILMDITGNEKITDGLSYYLP